jgi:adenylate cyclase
MQASNTRERRIILIDIDEPSLSQLGPWPWPRQRLADLSNRLAAEGTALQIFDIIFPAATSQDAQLVASLQKNHAILSQVFAFEPGTQASSGQPAAPLPWAACPANLPVAQGYIANDLAFADVPMGHITPAIESDGAVRHQPALICHQGKVYPALFVAALAQALASGPVTLKEGSGLLAPAWQLMGVSFDKAGIALDHQAQVRIPWTLQPDAFISLSAADVLRGRIPQQLLDNAWVIVGSSALGLNDRIASPFSGNSAGLLVHAQLLRGALEGSIPLQPRYSSVYAALTAALGALALAALGRLRQKPVFILVLSALALSACLGFAKGLLLTRYGLWFEWVLPALYLLLFALSLSLLEFARDRIERDRIYTHLASYLPRPVAEALARQDPTDAIDATRRNITVLFADIRNFSAYCETRPPEESTAVLHAFFSMITQIVEQHGGLIEYFQGDAVLAVWGSGSDGPAPEKALSAARTLYKQSRSLFAPPKPDELAPLDLGIGLETGLATVGSFGLARRRTHLAIGHPVTAATRLQEMTAELAHPILIGEGMAASLGSHQLVSQGMFLLEGLKNPSHIYAYPLRDCVE